MSGRPSPSTSPSATPPPCAGRQPPLTISARPQTNRRVGKRRACRKGNARRLSHKLHGFTFIEPVPLTAAILAVIVTVPAARPFTWAVLPGATPVLSALLTFARAVSLLVHIVKAAFSVSPAASKGHALRVTVLSTLTLSVAGVTCTVATISNESTVMAAELLLPSMAAVMVVDPNVKPLTLPFWPTLATLGALLVQSTV